MKLLINTKLSISLLMAAILSFPNYLHCTTTTTTITSNNNNIESSIVLELKSNNLMNTTTVDEIKNNTKIVNSFENSILPAHQKEDNEIIRESSKGKFFENFPFREEISRKQFLPNSTLFDYSTNSSRIGEMNKRSLVNYKSNNIRNNHSNNKWSRPHEKVGVILSVDNFTDIAAVRIGFRKFLDLFQINLTGIKVDFIKGNGDLNEFMKHLQNFEYSVIMRDLYSHEYSSKVDTLRSYCNLEEELSDNFNKTILLWPCPKMKTPTELLPSYEAISFAVKSIAKKLNWTEVVVFTPDTNWGLPLAIAANLHIPYRLEIDLSHLDELNLADKVGKAVIITSTVINEITFKLLRYLESYSNIKVVLIDIIGKSFNLDSYLYKILTKLNPSTKLISNILILTTISDKYRFYMNSYFQNYRTEIIQNFRQTNVNENTTNSNKKYQNNYVNFHDLYINIINNNNSNKSRDGFMINFTNQSQFLPILENLQFNLKCQFLNKLHKSLLIYLSSENNVNLNWCKNLIDTLENCFVKFQRNQTESSTLKFNQKNLSPLAKLLMKEGNFVKIKEEILRSCFKMKLENMFSSYDMHLREFFNFYDFIVTNIENFRAKNFTKNNFDSPKFDFIVLDIQKQITFSTRVNDDDNFPFESEMETFDNDSEIKASESYENYSNHEWIWRPFLILERSEINLNMYTSHAILPGFNDWLLLNSHGNLWYCGPMCWIAISISFIMLLIIVLASVMAGIAVRNYFLRKRLSKGPNKIVLSSSDFVFPIDARRVDEGIEAMLCCWLQQLQEFGGPEVDKPDLLKGSIGSLKNFGLLSSTAATTLGGAKSNSASGSLVRHNMSNFLDMRARYNGDLVHLKEISLNSSLELKSKAMDLLVMAHGLRHENINPLIGWLSDPSRTAMVFDYCSRGSLQDVLIMDDIKLDWSFRLSLLTDLVRGMRYLHASAIRVHGALTSRNCVVDARWVLKITDYGLPAFYEAQGLTLPSKTAKELLWTAPELLRGTKGHSKCGTQLGDVYSFGIIMQEVVVRGEPYCMLSLSPEEIIAKIKKPPPLIRPSVSKGAAPPEAINIMRQCWAETPDMRPDFNSVYERFKLLNHGRKVNFVDTMFQMLEKYSNNLEELIRERTEQLDIERKKTEQLLNRMLPSSVAEKLKMGLAVEPEEFSDVTIYFSDIVGFTTIAAHCSPVQVVDLLNDLYTIFDATINAYNVYKVETIGDAYMVVSGLPVRNPDHAEQIATMTLDLLHQSGQFKVKHLPGVPLQLRIGLHTGPCCAGVVGLTMPRYCLFGDTVNTASRMESTGSAWRIHMSEVTRDRLEAVGGFDIEPRGPIEIKGKGLMNTYWLLGRKGFDKPLPTPPPIGESHGLDESLIRDSIIMKAQANKSRACSTNPSSSQSSSLAGESVEVKVEITPPTNYDTQSNTQLSKSFALDSGITLNPSGLHLSGDISSKTPNISPQQRKLSELSPESLLSASNFTRLNSTASTSSAGSSSRLYKKIEEMIDLSSPYNHYKCLSPSENNLTQFGGDGKYLYGIGKLDNKPGSSRLLRRQFSLDRDDATHLHQTISNGLTSAEFLQQQQQQMSIKQTLEIPILQESRHSPKGQLPRLLKQNSTSIAQDLEKIEEIPMSPASSSCHHSSLDSSLDRSPPILVKAAVITQVQDTTVETKKKAKTNENCPKTYTENLSAPSISSPSIPQISPSHIERENNNSNSQEIQLNVEALMSR